MEKARNKKLHAAGVQDILFLVGIFLFSAVLILGLFPKTDIDVQKGKNFFLYYIMTIPVIAAVYFIIISFRRKLYSDRSDIRSSIRFKIALSFVFVSVLPSLPIILISNNLINKTVAKLFTEDTRKALQEAMVMSDELIKIQYQEMDSELRTIGYTAERNSLPIENPLWRLEIKKRLDLRKISLLCFRIDHRSIEKNILFPYRNDRSFIDHAVSDFLTAIDLEAMSMIHVVSVKNESYLLGWFRSGRHLIALVKYLPEKYLRRVSMYEDYLKDYQRQEFLKPYFQTGTGIFLLVLSILIIIIAVGVSIVLSRNIARPVLELAESAKRVAAGDFSVIMERKSSDELAILFHSFNEMVRQLDESRKIMFKTQKLEAWRDMARKMVHEIKNPLTPIRLAAERMQKKYRDQHPDIRDIVISGTETIIEEINRLMLLLSEFTKFARLPEMNPQKQALNPVIENCIQVFHGHERISFNFSPDMAIPNISFDTMLIKQAIINLFQNAVDAIAGDGTITITTTLVNNGEWIRISIADTGSGIETDHLKKIFEPTFSTKETGTGIGLTIVEMIILEHHGNISCHSTVGVGTKFIIDLPVNHG